MKRTSERSTNIDDRRGRRVRRGIAGGGLGTILLIVAALIFGINPMTVLNLGGGNFSGSGSQNSAESAAQPQGEKKAFVSQVLFETEQVWSNLFEKLGKQYSPPILVLFTGSTPSPCGYAQAAMGPFYCPADHQVYIDFSFYDELRNKFGARGDFAQAYVVAHEVAHHVQTQLGLSERVNQMKARVGKAEQNRLSVRFELQADCLSGVWAHNTHKRVATLEQGDIEEALNAAAAIGDDAIQRKSQGYVVPDSFTHGTSRQRSQWFMQGLKNGEMTSCNTF